MNIYYVLFIIGSLSLCVLGPFILKTIGSSTELPNLPILAFFLVILFLEGNHANFASFIVTGNNIPFVNSALISGFGIAFFSYISLEFTTYGLLGLVIIQGLIQVLYSNWKWPYVVCKEFNINFLNFLKMGFLATIRLAKQ